MQTQPEPFDTQEVLSRFREEGSGYLMWLVSERELRGQVLGTIRDEIRQNITSPVAQQHLWTLFLPKMLSLTCVAGKCNLDCRMCGGSPRGQLSYIRASDLYLMMSYLPGVDTTVLVASDSEPLLHPEFSELMTVLAEFRQSVMLITNGHLLTPARIEMLAKYPYRLDVGVSLDAATQQTYKRIRGASLSHAVENLRKLSTAFKSRPRQLRFLSMNFVGMADNIEELPDFVALAAELGVDRVKLDHMAGGYQPGDFTQHLSWREIMRKSVQRAGELGVAIAMPPDVAKEIDAQSQRHIIAKYPVRCDWQQRIAVEINGDIHPCCWTRDVHLGNMLQTPIYHNEAYLSLRAKMFAGQILEECKPMVNCGYVQSLIAQGKLPPRKVSLPVVA